MDAQPSVGHFYIYAIFLFLLRLNIMKLAVCLLAILLSVIMPYAMAENSSASANAFSQTFSLHGISFAVSSTGNTLRIVPSGLKIDNSPIERAIDGVVTGADVGDINVDQSPEIYVYVKAKDNTASLIAYSANKKKSLSEIYLPPFTDDPKLAKGYRGSNEIALVENMVAQRFPIYKDGDRDDKPTGGTRQLQYNLKPGEAGWLLKLSKTIEY
ncbi:hypothetical protein MCAMS1_00186 [biofilm metagenome]